MSKLDISKFAKGVQTTVTKYSPEILTGLGVAGMVTAGVLAVRATPKALILMEQRKEEIAERDGKSSTKLSSSEVIKTTWKCYIPAVATGIVSAACIIGANSVHLRRHAALATAYTLSENALKEYQAKVVETIGEKKEESIQDAIAKDRIERAPVTTQEIILTEKGNTLCYDVISGRYFRSDIDKIKKVENELNRRMRDEMYISLNDFYYEINLPPTKIGDDIGWNIDRSYIDLHFRSQLAEDGTPCLVIDYRVEPRYDYRSLM